MKRGMITLSRPQLDLIQSSISNLAQIPQELLPRITAAQTKLQTENMQQTDLEISEESAECILDSLPMPNQNEEQLISQTRTTAQNFLTSLRSSAL